MTKKSWTKEALKEPEKHPYIFLFFVTMATAVLGNGISGLILDTLCTWLDQYISIRLNKVGWQMIIVAILIVLLTFSIANFNLPAIIQQLLGKRPPYVSKVKPMGADVSCEGLIVFMSKTPPHQTSPAESAILHHWNKTQRSIRYCWIICGGKVIHNIANLMVTDRLSEQANSIIFIYDDRLYSNPEDPQQSLSLILPPDKIDDPNHIRQLIEAIYVEAKNLGIKEDQIFIDYTGGNKSMTAGAVLAGSDPQRRVQYIHNDFDDQGNIDWNSTVMMEVDISYRVKPIKTDR